MRISDWSSDVCSSDLLDQPRADGYRIGRLSNFCGRWIRHSGWWPDRVLRLFKREAGRFNDVAVHESVQCSGTVLVLDGHFLHYPYPDIETLMAKINRYSSEAAIMMQAKGSRVGVAGVVGHA